GHARDVLDGGKAALGQIARERGCAADLVPVAAIGQIAARAVADEIVIAGGDGPENIGSRGGARAAIRARGPFIGSARPGRPSRTQGTRSQSVLGNQGIGQFGQNRRAGAGEVQAAAFAVATIAALAAGAGSALAGAAGDGGSGAAGAAGAAIASVGGIAA